MYQFGVKIRQEEDGRVTAALLDFPSGPRGTGASAEEAYQDLIGKTTSGLTKFLVGGGRPFPLPDDTTPSISVELPTRLQVVMPPSALGGRIVGRDNSEMWNYSWRNTTVTTEG